MPALWGFGTVSGSIVGWGFISSTPASAGGPVLKARKAIKEHVNEAVQFEEIIEVVGRSVGYGSLLPDSKWEWQRDQLRKKSESRNIPEE